MRSYKNLTLGSVWKKSSIDFSALPFTASINGLKFSYGEAAVVISRLSALLQKHNISKGDRVALISENRAEWGLCWLAATTMGAVAVPVMIDFSSEQMLNILDHSGAGFVFVSEKIMPKIEGSSLVKNNKSLLIDNNPIFAGFTDTASYASFADDIEAINEPDDTAALIYTSGTTGASKGVLLSHKNIITNAIDSTKVGDFKEGDSMLSVLPLAHMYEFTQGFMTPLLEGANITYLGLKPSPTLMLKALEDIRPHYILSVPLLIEKIYKNSVLQPINKSALLSKLYKISAMRKLLNRFVIGKKLKKLFGGRLKFFGIGGAPLSDTVEQFLREAAFPYAVGYGLTETSPCLAGSKPYKTVFRGIGPAFDNAKIRVSEDGEVQASGDTIMKGYFKDEELTSKVFTEDGWFKTGDLGSIDEKGNLFIKGRLKNLILGPAGENIYPEEIENILKAEPLVSECLVLKEDNGLVARVFFDEEKLKQHFEGLAANISQFNKWKEETMEALRKSINQKLSGGSKINKIVEQETPFELTPSLKVKRFLYQKNDNLAW